LQAPRIKMYTKGKKTEVGVALQEETNETKVERDLRLKREGIKMRPRADDKKKLATKIGEKGPEAKKKKRIELRTGGCGAGERPWEKEYCILSGTASSTPKKKTFWK